MSEQLPTPKPHTRYFHVPVDNNPTHRRYSAAAQLKDEGSEAPYLLVAYSVCSEEDAFVKVVAREYLDEQLAKGLGHKVYLTNTANINKWGQIFLDFVKHIVPASTFPEVEAWEAVREVRKLMKDEKIEGVDFPTCPSNCYVQVRVREQVANPQAMQLMLSNLMQQADTNLGTTRIITAQA